MRYIDADELRAEFDYDSGYCAAWEFIDKPSDIQFLIDEQPTADVRENVRGEWLPMKRFGGEAGQTPDVVCSVCYAPALWLGTLGCIRSNYCPNCGADMRGES